MAQLLDRCGLKLANGSIHAVVGQLKLGAHAIIVLLRLFLLRQFALAVLVVMLG